MVSNRTLALQKMQLNSKMQQMRLLGRKATRQILHATNAAGVGLKKLAGCFTPEADGPGLALTLGLGLSLGDSVQCEQMATTHFLLTLALAWHGNA